MVDSPQIILCKKTQRVTIFKIPAVSISKGFYLDDWKQMIWQGGVKVIEKNKIVTLTFIGKDGKIFASTKIPDNYKQAIIKTSDSSRGFGVRLDNPKGGYLWIGVAFRDRDDAFDFGVAFHDSSQRRKMLSNPELLQAAYSKNANFSIKQGEKITINIDGNKKKKQQDNKDNDFFNDFNVDNKQQKSANQKNKANIDFFGEFNKISDQQKVSQKKKDKDDFFDF